MATVTLLAVAAFVDAAKRYTKLSLDDDNLDDDDDDDDDEDSDDLATPTGKSDGMGGALKNMLGTIKSKSGVKRP